MGCATLTEITLHHICETHRTCCIDLVGGMWTRKYMQRDEITCNAAARRTLSAFGLISSILDDMINDLDSTWCSSLTVWVVFKSY